MGGGETHTRGLYLAEQAQYIALYADDLLLFLKDTAAALTVARELLAEFGVLPGLRVNWQKSLLFPMVRGAPSPADLQELQWEPHCFRYLGVKVYHTLEDVQEGNVGGALRALKGSMTFWGGLPLSMAGHVWLLKMIALPRLLYFFTTLPIWLPSKWFRALDTLLIAFIWGTGRRRVALTTMKRASNAGGMAVPDLQNYYLAGQLQLLTQWVAGSLNPDRPQPSFAPEAGDVLSTFMGTIPLRRLRSSEHKVLHKCWSRCRQKTRAKHPYSPEMPMALLEALPHGGRWEGLKDWVQAGATRLGDLYRDGQLLPFEDFRANWDLPQGHFLLYGAVTRTMRRYWTGDASEPPTHATGEYMSLAGGVIKAVSCIYRAIRSDTTKPLEGLKQKWEEDLNHPIEDREWEKTLERAGKISRNERFRLISFYTLHRAYLTPRKIYKYFHNEEARCPRCGVLQADYIHMFWHCPRLGEYWQGVTRETARGI